MNGKDLYLYNDWGTDCQPTTDTFQQMFVMSINKVLVFINIAQNIVHYICLLFNL